MPQTMSEAIQRYYSCSVSTETNNEGFSVSVVACSGSGDPLIGSASHRVADVYRASWSARGLVS